MTHALAQPEAPDRRDALLAVLLYGGRLWNWAGLEEYAKEEVRVFGRRSEPVGALKARAAELASGQLVPAGVSPGDLPEVASVLGHEYKNYGDL